MDSTREATPKREEQVLVLAAAGLTDKEIAARLKISPDTVGTYWRRILAKYRAASRTEVVAKYTEDRASKALENLRYVNECLKLVADHMIEHGVAVGTLADAILASAPDWILLLESGGKVVFSNRRVEHDASVRELFMDDGMTETLALATTGPVDARWQTAGGAEFDFSLAPGSGAAAGHIVACGRRV